MSEQIQSVVITGPTGAIGMALIKKCIQEDVNVLAICHKGSKRVSIIPRDKHVTILEADLADYVNLYQKNHELQYDVFYHLAWNGTYGNTRNDMELQTDNIRYTLEAVKLAKRLDCHTFIGAGSQAEYGRVEGKLSADTQTNPENGYGMAKLCAGQMSRMLCAQNGIKHIWARFLSVYGPYDQEHTMIMSTLLKMMNNEDTAFTPCEQVWDYLYSGDAAEYLYRLSIRGKDGEIYVLGNGNARPLAEYIRIMQKLTKTKSKLEIGKISYGNNQVMRLEADINKVVRDTGHTPTVDFDDGIVNIISYIGECIL